MSREMHREMLDEMERSTWLDDDTKEETMIKLQALKWSVTGARREWAEHVYDDVRICIIYMRFTIFCHTRKNALIFKRMFFFQLTIGNIYFENVLNVREFYVTRQLKQLRKSRDPRKL